MNIKAVLFDLFNTLVLLQDEDAFYMPSLRRLHAFLVKNEIDVAFEDFVRAYFEIRDRLYEETSLSLEDPHFNVRISKTLKKLGYSFEPNHPLVQGATNVFCREFIRYARPDEQAEAVLKELHGRFKLGIVSNLSIPECGMELLKKFRLAGYFDAVVISGAINRRKPSPEIFKKALDTLNVKPDEAIFVGDTLGIDIKGAKAVGFKTILIERPAPPRGSESLSYEIPGAQEKIVPDLTVKNLKEITEFVEHC